MAPQWQNGACDTNCQEDVSACLLAHVNTAGIHVPLWIVAQNPSVGWGQDPEFPNQEGAFFGNVFTLGAHGTDPTKVPMYYCTGAKYNVNPPQGRVGVDADEPALRQSVRQHLRRVPGPTPLRRRRLPEPDRRLQGLQRLEQRRHRLAAEHRRHDEHARHSGGTGHGYRWR